MSRDEQPMSANVGFDMYRRPTRKHEFLRRMNQVIRWEKLAKEVEPYYPKQEGPGRPAKPLIWMLKLYFLQLWYGLSDSQAEDEVYDSHAVQEFLGIDLRKDRPPDEMAIRRFRHLLEQHRLAERLFERVEKDLKKKGIQIRRGMITDATIIKEPTSTKNQE